MQRTRLTLLASVCLLGLGVLALPGPTHAGIFDSVKENVKSAVKGAKSTTKQAVQSTRAAVRSAVPKGWTEKKWKRERAKAKKESQGLERYKGRRAQIEAKGTKLAAMPMKASSVEPRVAFITDDLLLTELFNAGFDAMGPDDINDLLGFETTKQELGSDDNTVLSEIGNTLNVRYLTAGSVADVEGALALSLKLIDVEHKKVLARVTKMADDGTRALPRIMAETVQQLVRELKM